MIERVLKHGLNDLWGAIGVARGAKLDEIKPARKKTQMAVHEDRNPNDRERAKQACTIANEAAEVLEDEVLRVAYGRARSYKQFKDERDRARRNHEEKRAREAWGPEHAHTENHERRTGGRAKQQ